MGIEFGAKRATDYVLDACNLVCVVRRQRIENVEGKCCEAKWNEECADKRVVWGTTNVWDGAILLTTLEWKWCVSEWKGEE